MSNQVIDSDEKCVTFLARYKANGRLSNGFDGGFHHQKRRSRRISERKLQSIVNIINSKLPLNENPSSNPSTDENFNLCIKNLEPPSNDDVVHSSTTISHLPDEMLCQIFSYLSLGDLYCNVSNVCQRWNTIAGDPFVWRNLTVDSEMDSKLLLKLLSQATLLQTLKLINRCDTNAILRTVIKYCPALKYLSFSNCRGNKSGCKVSFGTLMKAVTTNRSLKINLTQGTGWSTPPSDNSQIMKQYSVRYRMGQQNLITVYPIK